MRTTPAARSAPAFRPGRRRRAKPWLPAPFSKPRCRTPAAATATTRRGRPTGADIASCRSRSSSGRAGPTACTTALSTSATRPPAGPLSASLPEPVLRFLRDTRLAAPDETPPASALSGGVSSDIWRVDLAGGTLCVKGALARLRVSQVWEAPVERNRYEYEWLKIAGNAAPGAAPRVYAERAGLFAMEYLDFPVWKSLLREGHAEPAFAAK